MNKRGWSRSYGYSTNRNLNTNNLCLEPELTWLWNLNTEVLHLRIKNQETSKLWSNSSSLSSRHFFNLESSRSPPGKHRPSMEVQSGHVSRKTRSTCLAPCAAINGRTDKKIMHESIKVEINDWMTVRQLMQRASQKSLFSFPSLMRVVHLNVLRLSLQLLPYLLLPRVQLRRCETRMLSFQVSFQLRIRPWEVALVHGTTPRSSVHESPRARRLHRPVNLSSAVRTAQSLAAASARVLVVVSPVLLEAVGVTSARVAHVSATTFGEGSALQEDRIVWRLHADHTPHILPFAHTLWLQRWRLLRRFFLFLAPARP